MEIIRVGADIKIKCCKCGRSIMMPRIEFNKKLKKWQIIRRFHGKEREK